MLSQGISKVSWAGTPWGTQLSPNNQSREHMGELITSHDVTATGPSPLALEGWDSGQLR